MGLLIIVSVAVCTFACSFSLLHAKNVATTIPITKRTTDIFQNVFMMFGFKLCIL